MAKLLKEHGRMERKTESLNGDHLQVTIVKVNGRMINKMETAFSSIKRVHILVNL